MDYFTCGTVEFRSQDFVRNEEKYILFFSLLVLDKNIITTRTRSDRFIPVIRVL